MTKKTMNFGDLNVLILLVLIGTIVFVSLFFNISILEEVRQDNIAVTPDSGADFNFSEGFISLRDNQQTIFNGVVDVNRNLNSLNLLSQCDVVNIENSERPIEGQGNFRKVSVVTLVCPEIENQNN